MKFVLLSILICICLTPLGAQQSDSIEIHQNFWGKSYYQHDRKIIGKEIVQVLIKNPAAYREIRKARTSQTFSYFLSFFGGTLIGFPIGNAAGGNEFNWKLVGIGAGLIVMAIPFEIASNKRIRKAVNIYNAGLKPTSWRKPQLNFGFTRHGMGIHLSF